VFYRVIDTSRSVYRIQDIDLAIHTAATWVVRSAASRLDLDGLQSSREAMNAEVDGFFKPHNLQVVKVT
jgi:regulator of protease activity HflC (stomatin/prohibitin superfamily)